MTERELLEKRTNLVAQARAMFEKAQNEKRGFDAAEQASYDAIFADIAKIDQSITNLRKLGALEDPEPLMGDPIRPEGRSAGGNPDAEKRKKAHEAYLRSGTVTAEFRAMQADVDAQGGFYTSPQEFVNRLIQSVDNAVYLRQWGTPNPVTASQSLGLPYLAADPADAEWTSELKVGNEDSSMAFGKRELRPKPLAKLIKISNKLLRLSPDVEALAIARLGYKFGVAYEKAGMTGAGANGPLGVFVASDDGIPTSRDVSTGNTKTSIQTDGLLEAKYSLKAAYWPRAKWLFHRDAVKQLAKLQDEDGHYLWQPSITLGQPDMLYGIPLFASEYAPNTFTTGQYVGIIGDFSYYYYSDALSFSIQRLNELYAATNQTGFIGRLESDAMPVLAEAFSRVKLA